MFTIDVPLVFAFTAGFVAAFNPCGAAMFPAYVGYQLDTFGGDKQNPIMSAIRGVILIGADTSMMQWAANAVATAMHRVNGITGRSFRPPSSTQFANGVAASAYGIILGLAATAGFVVVFGAVGVILAAGGRVIGKFLPFAGLGVGVIIAALGLYLLLSKRKVGIMAASRVNLGQGKGVQHVFLFGIAYAVASLSCALPIFLAAIGIVAGQSLSAGTVAETIIGSITYGLGMGSVLVAATLGVVFFKGLVQRGIRAVFPYVEPIGNLAMVGAGVYLVYYWTLGKGGELLALRAEQIF